MGISLADARAMTFHEYTAMLTIWNARHANDGKGPPVAPPSPEDVQASFAALAMNPAMLH